MTRWRALFITAAVLCASAVGAFAYAGSEAKPVLPPLGIDTLTTLELPIVLHIGTSTSFTSAAELQPILAEVQRIYDYARIQIRPRVAMDTLATDSIDIYYRQRLAPNGVSHGRDAREIEVRDTVYLLDVGDGRPEKIALPQHLRTNAADPDSLVISQYVANQARTTAHELGHQLALPHRQDVTNLEASGTTGWTLNALEIMAMRKEAVKRFMATPLSKRD